MVFLNVCIRVSLVCTPCTECNTKVDPGYRPTSWEGGGGELNNSFFFVMQFIWNGIGYNYIGLKRRFTK